ncbi:hypothetical protein PRI8871_00883 [Pseudoprimorskyibacter insulae]|uniref:Uncharacterized protein n=1 Tax=Pseudoprimorskyibacter insulae TaxID=1695997 RepID=A0A2R8AQY4_9RHOB|nr:hypothetical protein PRI8871_00883 [Pseudoprimorskyibacter insulae]
MRFRPGYRLPQGGGEGRTNWLDHSVLMSWRHPEGGDGATADTEHPREEEGVRTVWAIWPEFRGGAPREEEGLPPGHVRPGRRRGRTILYWAIWPEFRGGAPREEVELPPGYGMPKGGGGHPIWLGPLARKLLAVPPGRRRGVTADLRTPEGGGEGGRSGWARWPGNWLAATPGGGVELPPVQSRPKGGGERPVMSGSYDPFK